MSTIYLIRAHFVHAVSCHRYSLQKDNPAGRCGRPWEHRGQVESQINNDPAPNVRTGRV